MTTIRTRRRGGLLHFIGRWLAPRCPDTIDIDLIEFEGLDGYLMRDIGLSRHHERDSDPDTAR